MYPQMGPHRPAPDRGMMYLGESESSVQIKMGSVRWLFGQLQLVGDIHRERFALDQLAVGIDYKRVVDVFAVQLLSILGSRHDIDRVEYLAHLVDSDILLLGRFEANGGEGQNEGYDDDHNAV